MKPQEHSHRYNYWLTKEQFAAVKGALSAEGYRFTKTALTPCQVLKSSGRGLVYAPPGIWSQFCARQGSWYRESERQGKYLLVSDHRLPDPAEHYLDSQMSPSGFLPERLPERRELEQIVASPEYQSQKPADWEKVSKADPLLFKILFSLTRFWRKGDSLRLHWLTHRANHANFLSRRVTTRIDGEEVPYSVSENAGVCSSCAEFFNIVGPSSRKLVRACPGSVIFSSARRDVFYDIQPYRPPENGGATG